MKHEKKWKLSKALLLEWMTIIGAVLTCFGILYSEIKGLDAKIERNTAAQSARSDRLYEMFIDLLKTTKCSQDQNLKKAE